MPDDILKTVLDALLEPAALMDVDAILPKPFDVETLLMTLDAIQKR